MNPVGSAIEANPQAEEARLLFELKRYEEALAACSRAIASAPEEPDNFITLCQIHLQLKQHREAYEAAQHVAALAPEWSFGYYLLSICLHHLLDFEGELRTAEHGAALDPESPLLLDRLARAQMQSGLLKRAKTTATQLIRVSPEDADTYSLLSDICFALDDFGCAEKHLLAALKLTPEDYVLHNDLGRIHLAKKAWQAAIEAFYQAARLNPTEKLLQNNLKLAVTNWLDSQTLRGRRDQALEELDPGVRAFYQHKLESRNAFERLGIFGPLLAMLGLLILLLTLFNTLL